jgi:tripartite-type tricarboxylate transporter receptor subunit TctC
MKRKLFLVGVLLLVVGFSTSVWGQQTPAYPERAVRVLVGFGAGGPADVIGRGILPILQEKLGVGVAITNLPGASGSTAANNVLQQPADGHTLFMGSETMSVWQTMGTMNLSYKNFIPIKLVSTAVPVLAVPPDSKFRTAAEFFAEAKANPGKLRIATAGPGTVPHASGLLASKVLGCQFTFVPYQGGAPAITAVMGSQVDATIEMVQSMVESYKGGKLKILASFTNQEIPGLDIPAIGKIETKFVPYLPYGPYFGLFAPLGTPDGVIRILTAKMDEAIKDQRWIEYTNRLYLPRIDYSGAAAVKFLEEWTSKSAWLLYDMGAAKASPADFGIKKP